MTGAPAPAPAPAPEYVINCDGGTPLFDLARTGRTEEDAARQLVGPVAGSALTAIDFNIGTTGRHNCRTRHRLEYTEEEWRREVPGVYRRFAETLSGDEMERLVAERTADFCAYARTIRHYNGQELDLLDIVIKHGHARGLKVFAGVRLNHANFPCTMKEVPGPDHCHGTRKDFRSREFHGYLLGIYADLLARGLDGLTLDFERKAPFFPEDAPQEERFEACTAFVRSVRSLGPGFVAARVAHEEAKGRSQGQDPVAWIEEGLLDAVIPATHNHEPDALNWGIERFVAAARRSSRRCRIWPQIWPTAERWAHPGEKDDFPERWHPAEAVRERAARLLAAGADGVYFFNFFPWPEKGRVVQRSVEALRSLPRIGDGRASETSGGARLAAGRDHPPQAGEAPWS